MLYKILHMNAGSLALAFYDEASKIKVGDTILMFYVFSDGSCGACRSGPPRGEFVKLELL